MWHLFFIRYLAIIMMMLGVSGNHVSAQTALLKQFDDVVFGTEHGPSKGFLFRWQNPPLIAFFVDPSFHLPPPVKAVRHHLSEITQLTGLDFKTASAPNQATLKLGLYPRSTFAILQSTDEAKESIYRSFITTSACLGVAVGDPNHKGTIKGGAIMIGTDIAPALRQHCILEELVQMMGLPNDACHYRPSLFCEDDHVMDLTHDDRILLKTLYDPRLTPGMTRAEVLPLAAKIIAEFSHSVE